MIFVHLGRNNFYITFSANVGKKMSWKRLQAYESFAQSLY